MIAPASSNFLCETFRRQAGNVWKRMATARKLNIALSEETITELVMYEIALAHLADPRFRVVLATKPQESKHGADWTWWFTQGGTGVRFRVQAKRLFPSGTYESLLKAPLSSPDAYDQ